jgi:nicotinamidase-related amidase
MSKALICIDFINEIVGENGKLAAKGYFDFVSRHNTLINLARLQAEIRESGGRVIHVHLGFENDYADHPASSPLLGGARNAGILKLNTPSTTLHPRVAVQANDIEIAKKRISAFYGTSLDVVLKSLNISDIWIAGVATDIAVQSAARDAHDRDFSVTVIADACAAASDTDHEIAIKNIAKFAKIQ